ncbi:hypothetical protein BN1263320073 [Stenotrophomonas indicatrix]|nr:hypothetical protein BN1263320073 [Stenotrophomonas indicatrix]
MVRASVGRWRWTCSLEHLNMALQTHPPQPGTSMKTLALIALSLSICISLAGCIAPFRVKAREYAAAGTTAPKTPAPSIPAAPPR